MNKLYTALTLSAFALCFNTADAIWGNTHTSSTNNGYPNQNYNGNVNNSVDTQSFTDTQRIKHAAQNAYYVEQNGGTVIPNQSVPAQTSYWNSTPVNNIAPGYTTTPGYNTTSNFNSTSTTGQVPATQNFAANNITGSPALLIQTARTATIERDMYGNTDGYVLTLQGVEPNFAFFNNHGQRMIGKVANNDFINSMKSTNSASAALVSTSTTPDNAPDLQESVLMLSNPVYDSRERTLKFNIDNLNGERLRAGSHQNAVLLIDSTFLNQ